MVVAALLVVVSVVVLVACLQHARAEGWKPARPLPRRARPLQQRAPDDLPPVGLAPLIPSPRALASEFERGLRELTLFLAVQPPD